MRIRHLPLDGHQTQTQAGFSLLRFIQHPILYINAASVRFSQAGSIEVELHSVFFNSIQALRNESANMFRHAVWKQLDEFLNECDMADSFGLLEPRNATMEE